MSAFTSPLLEKLKALRETHTPALPEPVLSEDATPATLGGCVAPAQPDPLEVGQQPGHCGSCARWEAFALPLAHIGLCSAGRAAHGWYDGNPVAPVEIQAAHRCAAHSGKGYRARVISPRPPAEPVAAAIPPLSIHGPSAGQAVKHEQP